MNIAHVKLVRDGNSRAVRLTKPVLHLSGLGDEVQMEVQPGKIILSSPTQPRYAWKEQMDAIIAAHPEALHDRELDDWDVTIGDGLNED